MGIFLISLSTLKEHEEVEPVYLEKLRNQIKKDGVLKKPIVVDKNTKIILDGHFRFNVLKQLNYSKIPVFFVDYNSNDILVTSWREGEIVTKEDVIKAGLNGKKLPSKTSKHMIKIGNKLKHISVFEKRVNIPLKKLGGE